jgi:Tfp pilus assembly protein PilW
MAGLGIMELLIVLAIPAVGVAGLAVLYFVIRAAVRAGNRDNTADK